MFDGDVGSGGMGDGFGGGNRHFWGDDKVSILFGWGYVECCVLTRRAYACIAGIQTSERVSLCR